MKIPTLEYLIMNNLEDLMKNDFFHTQEFLLGKTICDIALSNPEAVSSSIDLFKPNVFVLKDSILGELLSGEENSMRK